MGLNYDRTLSVMLETVKKKDANERGRKLKLIFLHQAWIK